MERSGNGILKDMKEEDITKKILRTIRENAYSESDDSDLINEDDYERDNFLTRGKILMEEAEQSSKKKLNEDIYDKNNEKDDDFIISANDPQFSSLRTSQEDALRKTIGDVELKDDALIYHPDIDDITLDFIVRGINCKVQFRYNDPSACGVYLSCADLQLSDENATTIGKIRSAFLNWKDTLTSDGSTLKDIEKAAERRND